MIPKKIHFCWLSGEEYPPLIQHCIDTWRKVLPDYEIVLWDTKRFDIDSVSWVREAFDAKKYAFAADYIRLYAVYKEGGIYLDSDVEMLKPFDDLLQKKAFIGFEASTKGVEAAVFGAEKGAEWCRKAMDFYVGRHFQLTAKGGVSGEFFAPRIVRGALYELYPDFPKTPPSEPVFVDDNNFMVCPAHFFSPLKYDLEKSYSSEKKIANSYLKNPETYCIHRFNAAWGTKSSTGMQIRAMISDKLKNAIGEKCFDALKGIFK